MKATGTCPKCQRWLTEEEPFCPVHGITATQVRAESQPPALPSLPPVPPPAPSPEPGRPVLSDQERGLSALVGFVFGGLALLVGFFAYLLATDSRKREVARIAAIWGAAGLLLGAVVYWFVVVAPMTDMMDTLAPFR